MLLSAKQSHLRSPARAAAALLALVCLLAAAPAARAASLPGAHVAAKQFVPAASYDGVQHLHYKYGPIAIAPGQNTIEAAFNRAKPTVPGYLTRFKPNLVYVSSGKVPRVDVIHLHHGVWAMAGYPTFAAGEEKTIFNAPQGYGYHYDPSDTWIMNYMIHNLTPSPTSIYITYDVDFVPDSAPAAAAITPIHPMWVDVAGLKAYPVFDALKGMGHRGRYTFPDDARGSARRDIGVAHEWAVQRDITLVASAGHVHPGGLWTDITATRGNSTKRLFRSEAKYYEPAGAVSWDVSLTATKPDWKVALRAGDRVDMSATYDVHRASWYEAMGINVVWYAEGVQPGARDPFTTAVDWHGQLTHGRLAENDNHGGSPYSGLPDPRSMLSGPPTSNVDINNYVYSRGDLGLTGRAGRPPVVRPGHSLTFRNLDSSPGQSLREAAYHTITACRQPCNRTTGVAYPLADAKVQFDSKQLGYGPANFTAASNRQVWKTPKRLRQGTYTYFCRVHPFMRGSFRVKAR